MKSLWRKHYSIILSLAISGLYLVSSLLFGTDLSKGDNLADAMGGVITAISIVLSFFGVMLAIVIPAQTQTDSVKIFFDKVDKDALISAIQNSLASGFITLVLSFALYFTDVLASIAYFISVVWVFALIYLFCSCFRFISLFLSVLLTPIRKPIKKDNRKVSAEDQEKLNQKLLEQIEKEKRT